MKILILVANAVLTASHARTAKANASLVREFSTRAGEISQGLLQQNEQRLDRVLQARIRG